MSDSRFFDPEGPFTLAFLAQAIGAELPQPERANQLVHDIADLSQAGGDDISLFCDASHASAFAASHAGVVVTSNKLSGHPHNGSGLLIVPDPKLAFAELGRLFYPARPVRNSIHRQAVVAASACIGPEVSIGPGTVIGEHAAIGAGSCIGANTVIGDGVQIGIGAEVGPNCSISHALIGAEVKLSSNVSIGSEGFGFVPGPNGPMRMTHVGRVLIGRGVEIGSNSSVDRGALGDTVIGEKTVIDNLVQIGHNVRIGKYCVLAGQVGVAGSAVLGDRVMVGGAVSISDHVVIGDGARIAGKSGVMRDIAAGETVAGYPAVPIRQWHRQTAALTRFPKRLR
jgi:UDP-3-O-[3-hydroxymyristoyl] glucosamine N-acyltransferase